MGLFKDPKSQHSYYVFCLLNLYKFEKFEDPSDRCADTICRDHITVFSFPHRPKKLFSISTRDNPRGLCEVSPMRLAAAAPDVHSGTNCIKIGLLGKSILSKRRGLWEVLFS